MRTNNAVACVKRVLFVVVYTYMVEHLEELGTGLVDGADDGAAALRQRLEQRQTLEARRAVQTAVITRQHTALNKRRAVQTAVITRQHTALNNRHIHKHRQVYKYGPVMLGYSSLTDKGFFILAIYM